jgi:hypothetical protein
MTTLAPQEFSGCFEVREVLAADGGLRLELRVGGDVLLSARASAASLSELERSLGIRRSEARDLLESALTKRLQTLHATVELTPPKARSGPGGDRLYSRYVLRDEEGVVAGVVWFDPSNRLVGDESVPPLARSKMRLVSLRALAGRSPSVLQFLASFLDEVSS